MQACAEGCENDWNWGDLDAWEQHAPELFALLASSAPQLRSLTHVYPVSFPAKPESALPARIRQLSQLSSLSLDFGWTGVTTAQVEFMAQGLPAL